MAAGKHRADVAAASAALLYNLLPTILSLEPDEQYRRLAAHIEASLHAWEDVSDEFRIPEPSRN